MDVVLKAGERVVDLQAGGFRLIQGEGAFRFGTDSVLLADFAAPRRHERAADLGCGDGAIAFLMAAHMPEVSVDAVELDAAAADRASRGAAMNGIEARVRVFCCDMRSAWEQLGREGHDLVVCNPPYGAAGHTIPSRDAAQRLARHSDDLSCEDIARAAAGLLRYGGRFATVFPATRALEMADAMRAAKLEPKRVRMVLKNALSAPKLILMDAVKGGRPGLDCLPPLLLYETDGQTSAEYKRIYGA